MRPKFLNKNWNLQTLAEIIELIGGGTPKTTTKEYWGGDIPWLSVTDFSGDNRYVGAAAKHITQMGLEKSSTKLLQCGDIIVSARGTVGEIAQLTRPMAFNQSCFGIRGIPNFVEQNFLFYLLRMSVEELRKNTHGSVFSTITRTTFKSIEVWLPPLDEQVAIAEVLGAFDDKIAVDQSVIEKVIKLASLLPERSLGKMVALSEVAELIARGITPRYVEKGGFMVLNQRCIRNRLVDVTQARRTASLPKNPARILRKYDVLINSTGEGTLGRISPWIREEDSAEKVITDSHVTMVRFDSEKVDPAYGAIVLASQERIVADLAEGSTGQTELKRDLLSGLSIPFPSFGEQKKIGNAIRPLLSMVAALQKEIRILGNARDELLPLLMSGKITVKDAADAAAEVGVAKRKLEENV